MGNYQSLNVLNQRSFLDDLRDVNAVNEVTAMVSASGNRSTRRRVEKALNKTQNISKHAHKKANERANKELQRKTDLNYVHFFAILALTMYEDYRWKESEENEHGQITSLMERVNKKILKYADYSTDEIVKIVDEKMGILLVTDEQSRGL